MDDIAREAGNNTRATVEGLVFTDENGNCELQFIECNRRPQARRTRTTRGVQVF